jgi:hypothetical protein
MGQSHNNSNSKATTAASVVVFVFAIFSVALRFYTRRLVKAGIASDDWWILAGLLLSLCTGGLLLYGMLGLGHPTWAAEGYRQLTDGQESSPIPRAAR